MPFSVPKIDIQGNFLDSPSIEWTMLSGARPNKAEIAVSKPLGEKLAELEGKVTLTFVIGVATQVTPGGGGAGARSTVSEGQAVGGVPGEVIVVPVTVKFQNLHVLELKPNRTPQMVNILLSDQRHFWEGITITRDYNLHRKTNKIKNVVFGAGRTSRATTIQFTEERHAPWSLKNPKTFRTFNAKTQTAPGGGLPWTAMGIVRNLLEQDLGLTFGKKGAGTYRFQGKDFDTKHQPENIRFEIESITSALDMMLGTAQAGLYQHPDGEMVLFSLQDEKAIGDILAKFQAMDGSGFPIRQDLKRVRPKTINAIFPKEQEIRFDYREGITTASSSIPTDQLTFGLWNVLQLPDTFTINIGNNKTFKYLKGTWMPVESAVGFWDTLQGPHKARGRTLSIKEVRKNWFTDKLEYIYTIDFTKVDDRDITFARRIGAIRKNYRQTYMIMPYWMDRIRTWKPVRSTVLDEASGTRQSSPIFQDYCEVPSFRLAAFKRKKRSHKAAQNIKGFSEKLDSAEPSPFTMSIIDQRLGIFTINFAQDLQNLIKSVIPSKVDNIPILSAGSNPQDLLWNKASLSQEHKFSTIVSVTLAEPNDDGRHYKRTFTMDRSNKDKVWDLPIKRDIARYRWTDATKARLVNDRVIIEGNILENEEAINAIADAEAERFRFSWKDLVIGTFTQPGHKPEWTPSGSMRSVTVKFSINRGLETVFNMTEKPPSLDIFLLLPQSVRNSLFNIISAE